MKYTGTSTRATCHLYCIKREDFSCDMCFTTTPYLPCNNNELYDFYYTAITLTTGYKSIYSMMIASYMYLKHIIIIIFFHGPLLTFKY